MTLTVWAWWFRAPNRRPALGPLRLLGPVLRVGLPEAAAVAITTLGMMAVLRLAAETGGTEAVAALGIALRLMLIVILPLEGFAIGVQPVLAHAFGAAKPERGARVLRHLIARGLTLGTALALVFCRLARPMAWSIADLPALVSPAAEALRWLALAFPALALRLIAQISLQAAIRPRAAMLLGLAPMGWLLWPALWLLVPLFGLSALPAAITLAAILSALLAAVLLRRAALSPLPTGVSA